MNDRLIKIINAAFFYLIWWGCILGIRSNLYYLGPILTTIFILVHLNIISEAKEEITFILYCGVLALAIESLHLYFGLLSYEGYIYSSSLFPPLWIICIWMTLAATLNYSMSFLKERWPRIVLCGGIFGPVCYYGAMKFEIIHFHFSIEKSIFILSAVWAICLPSMYYISKKNKG
jgi:hypothetical protein